MSKTSWNGWFTGAAIVTVILGLLITGPVNYTNYQGRTIDCGIMVKPKYATPGRCTDIIVSMIWMPVALIAIAIALVVIGFAKQE